MSVVDIIPVDKREPLFDENGLVISDDPNSKIWKLAALNEAQVFIEKDYVESAEELAQEYMPYMPKTTMLAAVREGQVVGSIRFIDYDESIGFKTTKDINAGLLQLSEDGKALLDSINPREAVEIGTIAIKKEFRGATSEDGLRLVTDLYGIIYSVGRDHNTPYVIASFDEDYFKKFSRVFGPAVQPIGPAIEYMGSPTIPVIMNVIDVFNGLREKGWNEFADAIEAADQKLKYEHRPLRTDSV